ncbi:MAG TPA: hypothetical protein VGQ11_07080 [Candidatus Acidoferrales bacterium]|nr:hypothetical protein [Candidatus Acidoferrales bacterium]
MPEDDDIREVMKAEQSRGRRPIDIDARRERDELRKILRELLKAGDEQGFMQAMRAYGWSDDSPEFQRALKIWRATPKT